jgi:hypothetical protein
MKRTERMGKPFNCFRFRILLRETGVKTGYTGYGNGRELENLLEGIIV